MMLSLWSCTTRVTLIKSSRSYQSRVYKVIYLYTASCLLPVSAAPGDPCQRGFSRCAHLRSTSALISALTASLKLSEEFTLRLSGPCPCCYVNMVCWTSWRVAMTSPNQALYKWTARRSSATQPIPFLFIFLSRKSQISLYVVKT